MKESKSKGRKKDMSSQLNGLSDLIIGQLSELGIEIFNETGRSTSEGQVPKAIYEITKGVSEKKKKSISRKKR